MPGTRLNRVSEPPEPCFPRRGTGTDKRPAFPCRQLDDAVDMRSVDMIPLAGDAVHELAMPAPARTQMKHFIDIAAFEDFGLEPPRMVVRCGVRLLGFEPVKRTPVVKMIFGESPRHAFDPDDPRAFRNASNGRSR
jgi:hypothetical protein